MEEMAASNEEMQALNEEVQASNEELQATNEELEASNEELQATNEELVSVNEESLIKSAELSAINSDFEGVYNTIDFPVMVFDPELFLKRANGAAIRTYDLPLSSIGTHLGLRMSTLSRQHRQKPLRGTDRSVQGQFSDPLRQAHLPGVRHSGGQSDRKSQERCSGRGRPHRSGRSPGAETRESQERLLSIMNHRAGSGNLNSGISGVSA